MHMFTATSRIDGYVAGGVRELAVKFASVNRVINELGERVARLQKNEHLKEPTPERVHVPAGIEFRGWTNGKRAASHGWDIPKIWSVGFTSRWL